MRLEYEMFLNLKIQITPTYLFSTEIHRHRFIDLFLIYGDLSYIVDNVMNHIPYIHITYKGCFFLEL